MMYIKYSCFGTKTMKYTEAIAFKKKYLTISDIKKQ